MTRHIYTARLVPIGTPVRIPFVDGSPSELQLFTDESFEAERTAKTKPPVYINHDANLQIGRVAMLSRSEGWWCADFTLDPHVPDDIVYEVGQPVSVGTQQLKVGSCGTFLREISIVRTGAVKGAGITRRWAYEPTPPAPPELPPVPKSSEHEVAEVVPIRRAARRRPTTFPRDEFDRRLNFAADLAENFGIQGVVEAEIEHMQLLERAMQIGRMPVALHQLLGAQR